MLQRYLPVLFVLGCMLTGSAQIKIGENPQNIHPASVLELESNTRALVITRVNTQEMNTIVPLQGAMVYNNDTQCIHFYDGNGWLNLCDALGLSFSTDPVVNPAETIVITETEGNRNFEVGQITGMNIVDFSIGGAKLQNNSITANKLAANSVGSEELQDNTVTDEEIDYNVVTLNDFLNDANFITGADIVSGAANNSITDNGGAFFDATPLQSSITTNTNNLDSHIAADGDVSSSNEIQDLILNGTDLTISGSNTVDLSSFNDAGSDDQALTLSGNTLSIEEANSVNLAPFLDNTDNQTLSLAGNVLSISGGNNVTIPTSDGSDTAINPGPGIDVSGSGAGGDPYIISNTFTEVDGSTTNELQNLDEVLADGNDAGGQAILNIIDNPSPTSVVTKAYVDAQLGGGGTTEEADGITIAGDGTPTNPFRIADGGVTPVKIAPGDPDQILRTDATGSSVTWVDLPAGGNQDLSQVLTQGNDAGALQISNLSDPSLDQDAATKKYVDDSVIAAGGGVPTDELITNFQLVSPNLLRITEDAVDWDVDLDAVFATDAELASLTGNGDITSANLTVGGDANALLGNVTLAIADDAVTAAMLNPDVAGNGITQNAAGALEVDPSTITGNGDITSTDLTVGGDTNALLGNVTLEIADDAVTASMLNPDVAGNGITQNAAGALEVDPSTITGNGDITSTDLTVGGDTNALLGNVTLEIADDAVTASMLNPDVAGNGITQNAAGALEVDPSTITGNGDITSTDLTVGGDANALLGNVTLDIADDAVTAAMINPDVAGNGITQNAAGALEIDPSTITGNGDITSTDLTVGGDANALLGNVTLDIADDAVTAAMINPDVAGNGITQNAAGALEIDPSTITGNGDITSTDLTVGGDANALLGNVTLDITDDAVTAAMINPDVAGNGITQNAAGALEIDPSTITGNGDITSTDLTVGGDANALLGNVTLDIADDAVTATMLNPDVAGNGITQNASGALEVDPSTITGNGDITSTDLTVGGDANALLGNVTLDIADDAVTAAMLNPDVAGNGITQNASGALEVDPSTITGNGDITSTDLTVGGDANALLGNVTLDIAEDAVTAAMLNPDVAGNGITQNAAGALEVDPSSITGNGDITSSDLTVGGDANALLGNVTLDIADNAITTSKIQDNNVTPAKIQEGNDGQVLTTNGTTVSWQSPNFVSPIKAWGKIFGDFIRKATGVSSVTGSTGSYKVTLNNSLGNPAHYTIILSVEGDNRIYVTAQNPDNFEVIIKENGTNALVNATWHFSIIDN